MVIYFPWCRFSGGISCTVASSLRRCKGWLLQEGPSPWPKHVWRRYVGTETSSGRKGSGNCEGRDLTKCLIEDADVLEIGMVGIVDAAADRLLWGVMQRPFWSRHVTVSRETLKVGI